MRAMVILRQQPKNECESHSRIGYTKGYLFVSLVPVAGSLTNFFRSSTRVAVDRLNALFTAASGRCGNDTFGLTSSLNHHKGTSILASRITNLSSVEL